MSTKFTVWYVSAICYKSVKPIKMLNIVNSREEAIFLIKKMFNVEQLIPADRECTDYDEMRNNWNISKQQIKNEYIKKKNGLYYPNEFEQDCNVFEETISKERFFNIISDINNIEKDDKIKIQLGIYEYNTNVETLQTVEEKIKRVY